jgi:Glycosyl hydrolases family 2, sugar binding domain
LQKGGKAVLLPDNSPGSFPLESWWFLRGGPVITSRFGVFGADESPGLLAPREMLVELQHFDLAGDVVRNPGFLESIDPLVMLWESHDLTGMQTNGLLWRMPVGDRGALYVSALNHEGEGNEAGCYLLGKLVSEMSKMESGFAAENSPEAEATRSAENLRRLESEIRARRISLESRDWKFMPDAENDGAMNQWHEPGFDDSTWATIRADKHWEGQGHPTLDGWAWYRLKVDVPADWPAGEAWLNFQGVDDYCDVYVNGQKVGSAGNIEKRETAFDLHSSHDIGKLVEPGKPLVIAVAVYDWYGAGGIFRPVELSTMSESVGPRWLK